MSLNRGCALKIEGVFKMTGTPPLVALCLTQMSMAVRATASDRIKCWESNWCILTLLEQKKNEREKRQHRVCALLVPTTLLWY